MEVPAAFHGNWRGEIRDRHRVNSYPGEISITAHGVATLYEMKRGYVRGVLTIQGVTDDVITLHEAAGSFTGIARFSLDSQGRMKCVWSQGKRRVKETAEALMTKF